MGLVAAGALQVDATSKKTTKRESQSNPAEEALVIPTQQLTILPPLSIYTTPTQREEMASALRVAASRAARNALARSGASPASVGMPVRCLSSAGGEYNPFTHSLDRLNTKKVSSERERRAGWW
jgi:hypothetical protein